MVDVKLTDLRCVPCRGGEAPLKGEIVKELSEQLSKDWQIVEEHHLERQFKFKNFLAALDFVSKAGWLAEDEGHHPDICFGWGWVKITLWTHKIGGLSKNDFILAAKIDQI